MHGSSVASLAPIASTAPSTATASEWRLFPFDRGAVAALLVLQLGLGIGLATRPMTGPRELDAGAHVVDGAVPTLPLALLWADAAELGLPPFLPSESR